MKFRRSGVTLTVLLILALTNAVAVSTSLQQARVRRVIDGDTIEVKFADLRIEVVRYIGIDTPETHGGIQCYGPEASSYNSTLVNKRTVWLETDVEARDKYDRLLAYVYLDPAGCSMVNAILVAQGYAQVASYPPNLKHQKLFKELECEAREDARGLWCNCQGLKKPRKNSVQNEKSRARAELTVVISCIHFDASGNDHTNENGEWVLIEAREKIDLSGWKLTDESNRQFVFPSGFSLGKEETVRIYTGFKSRPKKDSGCGQNPRYELFWGSETAIWNNGGDVASLKKGGETVDSCSYLKDGENSKEVICSY